MAEPDEFSRHMKKKEKQAMKHELFVQSMDSLLLCLYSIYHGLQDWNPRDHHTRNLTRDG